MFIDFDRALVFVHVPKAAGCTVREHLSSHAVSRANLWGEGTGRDLAHATIEEAKEFISAAFLERAFKFAVVRNPVDRLVSIYHYLEREPRAERRFSDLSDLVSQLEAASREIVHLRTQTSFLYYKGKVTVDRILRYDRFAHDFSLLCMECGLTTDFGWHNQTVCASGTFRMFSEKELEALSRFYRADFENFGFKLQNGQ